MSPAQGSETVVIDTGPLSHFAEAGWIGALRGTLSAYRIVVPDAVVAELRSGVHANPHLRQVLDADWFDIVELTSPREIDEFARFAARLIVRDRNHGETAVLAYANAHSAIAVVDDGAARRAARDFGVTTRPTLALLCDAIREGFLTPASASALSDHLIETEYRLPFRPGQFIEWATGQGLI